MIYLIFKFLISALLIVGISEIAKRSVVWAGITASLPLVSVLSLIWTYQETSDTHLVSKLSTAILWLVLPSLLFFISLPWLLNRQVPFYIAVCLAIGLTVGAYYLMLQLLQQYGIKLE